MFTRRETLEYLIGLLGGGLVLFGAAAPELPLSLGGGIHAPGSVSPPGLTDAVIVFGGLLVTVVAWIAVTWLFARGVYRVWRRVGDRVQQAVGLVLPSTPLVQFATGVTLFLALLIVIIGVLPALVGDVGGGIGGPEDVAGDMGESGATNLTQTLVDEGLNEDWTDIVDRDTIPQSGESSGGGGAGEPVCQNRTVEGQDTDNDGLPDEWERAGETPNGTPLPDADPGRKDVFLQINYGSNVDHLTDREREQLRAVWDRMPVDNPDGSTGISLHVDDSTGSAGGLDQEVVVTDRDEHAQFYTAETLGERLCVYHQVTYGRMELGSVVGVGSMPGYASVAEGSRQPDYEGDVSFRVAVTTHELLHNVAGQVEGRPHTTRGWLAGGPDEEFLSEATTRELNENGLFGPLD